MFTKNVISQDMIDAVNSILMQEEKKEMLLEPGKKMELETGFHMAAHAAKKANQTHFEFQGKKYPVTAKSTAEAIEEKNKFDPLKHVKNPTPGEKAAAKDVKRGSYADRAAMLRSAQADGRLKEEIEELDELSKKTLTSYRIKSIGRDADFEKKGYQAAGKGPGNEKSDRLFNKSDLVTTARDSAKRKLMNSEAIEEEKDDDSMYTTKAQAKKIADKEAAKEVHKHEKNLHKGSKETKFDEERHMSDDEMAKREKIVKSMKKGMAGFKERYGNRAKNVMYATATKQAMKEEVQEAAGGVTVKKEYDDKDESEHGVYHGKKKIGYVVHDKKTDTHTAYHGHKYGKDDYENSDDFQSHEKAVNQIKSSAALKEEVNHLNEEMHFRKTHKMSHVHSPDTISVTHAHHKNHGHIGHIEEYHECDAGGKHTGNKKYAIEHYPSGKQMHGCDTSEEAAKHLKKFHEDHCEKMESMGIKMEEIGGISTISEKTPVKKSIRVDTLKGIEHTNSPEVEKDIAHFSGKKATLKAEAKTPGDNSVPFVTDEKSPMSIAKKLAQKSFKKIKNETMMGKLGTSE